MARGQHPWARGHHKYSVCDSLRSENLFQHVISNIIEFNYKIINCSQVWKQLKFTPYSPDHKTFTLTYVIPHCVSMTTRASLSLSKISHHSIPRQQNTTISTFAYIYQFPKTQNLAFDAPNLLRYYRRNCSRGTIKHPKPTTQPTERLRGRDAGGNHHTLRSTRRYKTSREVYETSREVGTNRGAKGSDR